MVADRITVGVFALDQVRLPTAAVGKGWAQRLAEASATLAPGARPRAVTLEDGADGLLLVEGAELSGTRHFPGARVGLERISGRVGQFLVRIAGRPVGVAAVGDWEAAAAPLPHSGRGETLGAYAAGTLIDTPDGPRPDETLAAGDVVTTLANGSRPLRWVGRRWFSALELLASPGLRPVEFAPGVIGNGRALLVSPQQRMLIDDWRAAVYFGEDRVLVAAQALVDDHTARVVLPPDGVHYVFLLCDRHEVLLAEGALSESFHPGEAGLEGLGPATHAEIAALVPEADLLRRRAAFPIVRSAEARALRL